MTNTAQNTVQSIIQQMEAERAEARKATGEHARIPLLQKMYELKIPVIKVSFNGSGDDGSIDNINVVANRDVNVWEGEDLSNTSQELKDDIEDYCYKYLEGTGVDWCNNEGGQGEFVFDAVSVPPQFHCTVEYNVMTTEIGHEVTEVM